LGAGNETGYRGVELVHSRYRDYFVIAVELSEAILHASASQAHSIVLAHVVKLRLGAVHIHAEGYPKTPSGGHTNQIERVRTAIRNQNRSILGIHGEHLPFNDQILAGSFALRRADRGTRKHKQQTDRKGC